MAPTDISNNLGNPQASEVAVESVLPFIGNDVRESLQSTLTDADALIAKRYEDRNLFLTQGGLLTYDGSQLTMTEDLKIEINSKIAGGAPTLIDLGPGPFNVNADGDMIYAIINRTAATAVVLDNQTTLPAVVAPNYEVFLIAKRRDATDGTSRLYFLDGSAVNAGQTVRLGATGAPETSLTGDDLTDLTFLADFQDGFFNLPGTNNPVNTNSGFTQPSNYSVVHRLWKLTYDASKTLTGTGINVTLSAAPSYTVSLGDIVRVGSEARRISTLNSQTSYTLESAFSVDPSASPCTVSQVLYTRDINNFAPTGELAISAALPGTISEVLVAYTDNNVLNNAEQSLGVIPNVAFTASSDGTNYSIVQERPQNLTDELFSTILPTSGTNMYIRFFSNATSGSGFCNVLNYKAYFHKEAGEEQGELLNQAYANLNSSGTQQNCTLSVLGGKTLVTLTNGFVYSVGLNPGLAQGQLDVYIDGQIIDRFVDATTTPFASYQEVDAHRILLDSDYSGLNKSLKILQRVGVIDSSDQNTTNIAQIQANANLNLVDNPEGYLMQRIDPVNGTIVTNNVYGADRWKLQCSSAGVTVKRVAANAPGFYTAMQSNVATSAGFFGHAQFKEASESVALQGQLITFGVSAKSSNSTVNQIRITVLGWEGTADAPTTNLVSSWASSPTFATNYTVYGTATMTLNSTFSYGEVTAIVGEGCQNLVFFVHSTASQAPGNLLELTGMQANFGASLLPYRRQSSDEHIARCLRYYEKSYELDTIPGSITENGAAEFRIRSSTTLVGLGIVPFKQYKANTPVMTPYNSITGTINQAYNQNNGGSGAATIGFFSKSGFNRCDVPSANASEAIEFQWTAESDF
jgi:hypothetical protein